ncbi:MAG TPA: hypothetical protein VKY37_13520 [Brumimicrobium sp.]|nr:hypothetical protein [Brumimicrobium sp.]
MMHVLLEDLFHVFPNKNVDKLLMFSAKPGVGQPAVFTPDAGSGSFDYKPANVASFTAAGVEYQWGGSLCAYTNYWCP